MKLTLTTFIFLILTAASLHAQDPFITTWKTDNPGASGNDQITIPTFVAGIYNYDVDWGDGNSDTGITGDITHTYTSAGTYTVEITGDFPGISFNNSGDKEKILTIDQWGDIEWTNMFSAFFGASNLELNAADAPDLSGVFTMFRTFSNATSLNSDLNNWDVSNVTNMNSMFEGAESFNGDISNWDVSNVTGMNSMFQDAAVFNADISGWNTGSVTNMTDMFRDASVFNQNLSDWDVSSVNTMSGMLDLSGISVANYDATLVGWAGQTVQDNVTLGAAGLEYCTDGEAARQSLIDNHSWTINGDALAFACDDPGDPFITTWKTDNPGASGNDQITIPTSVGGIYNYDVDWGDGNSDTGVTGDITHTYDNPDTYTVEITGDFPQIYFNNSGDKDKILTVEQWGDIEWAFMNNAFFGASNLVLNATDAPDLSGVTSLNGMFLDATSLNSDLNHWDVSNVTLMNSMFQGASAFNGDISNWDVSNVISMNAMFQGAAVFNADISGWNTGSVTSMANMFRDASAFDQDLGGWNIGNVTVMTEMLDNSSLIVANYDATLVGWAGQTVQDNVTLGAGGLEYCTDGQAARQSLIDNHSWTITSDALAFACGDPFISTWKTDNPGLSDDDQITIPTNPGSIYDVYWEDVTDDAINGNILGHTGDLTITFPTAGTYRVEIIGDLQRIIFANGGDKEKILTITQWGDIEWTAMSAAFFGASNLELNAADAPDLSGVTNMTNMFTGASSLNSDLSHWDVSGVANMRQMFQDASAFNGDISNWDVSNVTDMSQMFSGASAFNQNLSLWDVSSVTDMGGMLGGSGLSIGNYDETLIGWAAQNVQNGVELGVGGLEYCDGAAARQSLIDNDSWMITGDAPASGCDPSAVLLTGIPGFRMLSAPAEVSLAGLLEPIWTQGASGGADYTGGDPNVWTWDTGTANWMPVTGNLSSTTVAAGTGVLVYVFDEDEFGNPASGGFPKTLLISGTETGNALPVTPTINNNSEGFTLLGNPVNSGIDWNGLTLNEVENTVYVWDPNKGASGDYVFWNGATGDLTNGIIHPFQGFFVQTSAGASSPSLTIPATSATVNPGDFYGKETVEEPLVVRLQMEGEQGLGSTAWLQFSEKGSLTSNRSDALKLQPLSADYAALALEPLSGDDPSLLALKHLPLEMATPLEIPLTATATRGGNFTLETTDMNLPDGWSLSIRDTQTGEKIPVEQGMEYSFELDVEEAMEKSPDKLVGGGIPACGDAGVCPPPVTALTPQVLSKQKEDNSSTRFLLTITPAGGIEADLPDQITLEQNYPNPFNPATVISYQLPQQSQVRLEVYDMVGRQVATLVDGQVAAGTHQVNFDASNFSSGVYLYRLQTADAVFTKKLTLIK